MASPLQIDLSRDNLAAPTLPVAALRHDWVVCPLCGADDARVRFQVDVSRTLLASVWVAGREYRVSGRETIVTCQHCGLSFVNPRLAGGSLAPTYSPEMERVYFQATREERRRANADLLRRLPEWLRRTPATLFDFGCGDGLLLEMAAAAGIQCVGYDVSEDLRELVAERLGATALVGHDWATLPEASFDVVALINVIEHLEAPLDTLCALRRLLSPGGLLLVHAPNFGGLAARLRGASWHQVEPFGHLTYFTAATLGMMLGQAGFEFAGRFVLKTTTGVRALLQSSLARAGLFLDNSLGMVARRPG
jgi:2-polyprenyl-3-methyl-5-hydroxy-6-metoxy-1,4-benzoquinol methylase